jgi:hypothetical protein
MAQEEEALPPWGALPADMLQGVFAALPDAASRGACRRVCRHWRQVADQGPEVWQSVHCRCPNSASYLRRTLAPTEAGEPREPARRRATVEELSALLSRQRVHLRRLTLEENAGAWEDDAAQGLAAVLTAAAGDAGAEGSGLTDLTLVVAEQLPQQLMEVLPGGAVHLTSLVLRPLRGHVPSLHWEQFGSRLQQLHSVSLTGRLPHFETSDSLRQLTALTRLRLANAHNLLPDVSLALLAWPSSLVRLELSGLSIRLPNPQQLVEMGGLDLPAPALALIQQLAQQMAGLPLAQPPAVGVQQQVAAAQGQPAAAAGQAAAADQAAAAPAQPAAGQAAGPPGQPAAPAPPPLPVAGSIGASLLPHWQRLEHLRLHNCELDGSLVTGELCLSVSNCIITADRWRACKSVGTCMVIAGAGCRAPPPLHCLPKSLLCLKATYDPAAALSARQCCHTCRSSLCCSCLPASLPRPRWLLCSAAAGCRCGGEGSCAARAASILQLFASGDLV